ncbi:polyamine aminopropyltransferase [Candidatus Bipolaricaulota sp. J31]
MSSGGRRDDWLSERQTEGVELSFRVRRWLVRKTTAYQRLELAETEDLGRVMALDGKIMLSERDEAFYHEMLVHPALLAHPSPRKVLIVGGGDGGTMREVLQHPTVDEVWLVEIDGEVVEAAKEHLPSVHRGSFADPRARVKIAPGEEFVTEHEGEFDAVIVDSTDPVGPGEALFTEEFFRGARDALTEGGVLAMQAGTPFYWGRELGEILTKVKGLFSCVRLYLGHVPVYPSGMWAYVLASERDLAAEEANFARRYTERGLETVYFTPALGRAAFVLPRFVEEIVHRALRAQSA